MGCSDSAGISVGGLSPASRRPRSPFGVIGGFGHDWLVFVACPLESRYKNFEAFLTLCS